MKLMDGHGEGLMARSLRRWSEKLSLLPAANPMRWLKLLLFWAVPGRTLWDLGVEIRSVLI